MLGFIDQDFGQTMSDEEIVRFLLVKLPLEQKIGQLIWLPFAGLHTPRPEWTFDKLLERIERFHVGGFVMYGGDVFETPAAINYLQKNSRLPLLIASDVERGCGQQVTSATVLPAAMAVGATGSVENAALAGRITGNEARTLGITVVLAPVADVNTAPGNPIVNTRAFGDDTEFVAAHTASFVSGCQREDVMAVAKHFPGHGATTLDSHLEMPTLDLSLSELERVHIPPFAAAVRMGVKAVMVAHLRCPALDPVFPTSLSHATITDLLRKKLGFGGLVMTDALMMGATAREYGDRRAAVLALTAGADVILYPEEPEAAFDAVLSAVKSGNIRTETLDSAVERVIRAKVELGLFRKRTTHVEDVESCLNNPEHLAGAKKIAEESMTPVGRLAEFLPLKPPVAVIVLGNPPQPDGIRAFLDELKAGGVDGSVSGGIDLVELRAQTQALSGGGALPNGFRTVSVDSVGPDATVICAVFKPVRAFSGNITLGAGEVEEARALMAKARRSCVVSFGSPYVVADFPESTAALCAYSDCEVSQRAAARVILGRLAPRGKLPVKMPHRA
ncbi:MAG: glycoside hydrolase family 3 N-terminal domain-containing protein [Planctomycetota bacterium]|nr:glycoside hydrolase family 3 N-terminal domain-containing protein [Planctomycetota bacterium]